MRSSSTLVTVLSSLALTASLLVVAPTPALAAGFVVTTANDLDDGTCAPAPGHCSLREAINAANATPAADTITFAIPGPGVHLIQPSLPLPAIIEPLSIDGYSQPGSSPNTDPVGMNAVVKIQLDGSLLDEADGLRITGGGSSVRGLVISNFQGPRPGLDEGAVRTAAIRLDGGSGNVVAGNLIGTDPTGLLPEPNRTGVVIRGSSDNVIGGSAPANRNLISGNHWGAIYALGALATHPQAAERNQIVGNLVGLDATGDGLLSNTTGGGGSSAQNTIWLQGADDGLVARNAVAAQGFAGIHLGCCADDNVIRDNLVGLNAAGTHGLGVLSAGIDIFNSDGNLVGGSFEQGNVVGSAVVYGIFVGGSCTDCASHNTVAGNAVGTDGSGVLDVGNDIGIFVSNGPGNRVGVDVGDGSWGNLVAGNRIGVLAGRSGSANGPVIEANRIGTVDLGNDEEGVRVTGAQSVRIGGTSEASQNTIVGNGGPGISVVEFGGSDPSGIAILRNSISGNDGLGIDLGDDGVTPNDAGDADNGPNGRQNYPTLHSAASSNYSGMTVIEGTLDSAAGQTYSVDTWVSSSCDPTGFGEGSRWLATTNVITNASGQAAVSLAVPEVVPVGKVITATARASNGDTSEFSACVEVTPLDSDGDGLPDDLEVELGTDPDSADTDGDGVPDGSDVEFIQSAIEALPVGVFGNRGDPEGQRNAMLNRLDEIEAMIAAGDEEAAIDALQDLRRRVDGCSSASGEPDANDWIIDCAAQLEIRALIDLLIANLSASP